MVEWCASNYSHSRGVTRLSPSNASGNQFALSSTTIPLKSSSTETNFPSCGASPNLTTSLRIAQCCTEILEIHSQQYLLLILRLRNALISGKTAWIRYDYPVEPRLIFLRRVIIRVAVGRGGFRSNSAYSNLWDLAHVWRQHTNGFKT